MTHKNVDNPVDKVDKQPKNRKNKPNFCLQTFFGGVDKFKNGLHNMAITAKVNIYENITKN